MSYAVSVRWYDENEDWNGVEWRITRDQAQSICKELIKRYGEGTEL